MKSHCFGATRKHPRLPCLLQSLSSESSPSLEPLRSCWGCQAAAGAERNWFSQRESSLSMAGSWVSCAVSHSCSGGSGVSFPARALLLQLLLFFEPACGSPHAPPARPGAANHTCSQSSHKHSALRVFVLLKGRSPRGFTRSAEVLQKGGRKSPNILILAALTLKNASIYSQGTCSVQCPGKFVPFCHFLHLGNRGNGTYLWGHVLLLRVHGVLF